MENLDIKDPPELYHRLLRAAEDKFTELDSLGLLNELDCDLNCRLFTVKDKILLFYCDYSVPSLHPSLTREEINKALFEEILDEIASIN